MPRFGKSASAAAARRPESRMGFPAGFTWGVASSAYQIEGAADVEGKGPSVWDEFCRVPGNIAGGHRGDVACDHFHRFRDDVALMKSLGVAAYRFSVSWPRVMPQGRGRVNEVGLGFYDRLVDSLLENGIEPWVTLFHWDYPLALMADGGWLERASADWFADYAAVVAGRLSDRVTHWMTLNEPQVFLGYGHFRGTHAPGLKLDTAELLRAAHHVLLAHGKGVQAIRAAAARKPTVGWAVVAVVSVPEDPDSPADVAAAREAMVSHDCAASVGEGFGINLWSNTWWNDPVFRGAYPEEGIALAGNDMPEIAPGDMALISQPLDFLGLNIYTAAVVRADGDGRPAVVPHPPATPLTAFKWPVVPSCLHWGPRFLHERYRAPIAITENGLSLPDWVALDGAVHDPQRIDYLARHLRELGAAIGSGTDVRGYFQWSILDNFEWAEGFRERFGLVHVDYETQQRTPKDSAFWYRDLIASNGHLLRG